MTDAQNAWTRLNDGLRMPPLGFGTWPLTGDEGAEAVRTALATGYRLVDTASRYDNEDAVGRAVAESDVARSDLFITSKLRGDDHGYDATLWACEASLERLGLTYLDLYLIHWPLPRLDKYVDSWRAFIELRERGLVRSIGVSNFTGVHIDRIAGETDVVPAVNQIELHPYFPQAAQRAYDASYDIVTQSWSPLGRGAGILAEDAVARIASAHDVTPSQVVLAWHLAIGAAPIPKSADPQRMRDNLDAADLELTPADIESLAALDSGTRLGGDPGTHEEF